MKKRNIEMTLVIHVIIDPWNRLKHIAPSMPLESQSNDTDYS